MSEEQFKAEKALQPSDIRRATYRSNLDKAIEYEMGSKERTAYMRRDRDEFFRLFNKSSIAPPKK